MRFYSFLNNLDKSQPNLRKPAENTENGNGNIDYANVINNPVNISFSSLAHNSSSQNTMFVPLPEEEFASVFYTHTNIYNNLAKELNRFTLPNETDSLYSFLGDLCLKKLTNRSKYSDKSEKIRLLDNTSNLYSIIYSTLMRSMHTKPEVSKTSFLTFFEKFTEVVKLKEKTFGFEDNPAFKLPFNRILFDIINDLGKICSVDASFKCLVAQIFNIVKHSEEHAQNVITKYYNGSSTGVDNKNRVPTWSELYLFRKFARDLDFLLLSLVSITLNNLAINKGEYFIYPLYLAYRNICTLIRFYDLLGSFTFSIGQEIYQLIVPQFFTKNLSDTILSYTTSCFEYKDLTSSITSGHGSSILVKSLTNIASKVQNKITIGEGLKYNNNYDPEKVVISNYIVNEYKNIFLSDVLQQNFMKELLAQVPINYINNDKNIFFFYDFIIKNLFGLNTNINIFDQIVIAYKKKIANFNLSNGSVNLASLLDDVLAENKARAATSNLHNFKKALNIQKFVLEVNNGKNTFKAPQLLMMIDKAETRKQDHANGKQPRTQFEVWLADSENKIYFILVISLILVNIGLFLKLRASRNK